MLTLPFFKRTPVAPPATGKSPEGRLEPWRHGIQLKIVRQPRARRYLLRLQHDGVARLVIPRRGSRAEAFRFLERSERWLLQRFGQWQSGRRIWGHGTEFLFRGERTSLHVEHREDEVWLSFAEQTFLVPGDGDYRELVLHRLRQMAEEELPRRAMELAEQHEITIRRITVRAQKTRWGSCSSRGTISLNWRLIQAPPFVRDYLIVHELMHRREMNHSTRFWKLVAEAFPDYRAAERWLKSTRLGEMD